MPHPPRPLLLSALVLAGALAPAGAPSWAAEARTRIHPARYDAASGAIVMSFDGPAPAVHAHSLSPTHHYYDFRRAFALAEMQILEPRGQVWRAWVANRPDGSVRIAFNVKRPSKPRFRLDARGRRLLIYPLGAVIPARPQPTPRPTVKPSPRPTATPTSRPAASPTPKPTRKPTARPTPTPRPSASPIAARTRFTDARFDEKRQALVLPFQGDVPRFTVAHDTPAEVRLAFADSTLATPMAPRTLPGHPLVCRWQAEPLASDVSVTMELAADGEVVVAHDEAQRQILLIPQLYPAGTLSRAAGPVRTVLSRLYFDPKARAIVVPYFGEPPAYAVGAHGATHHALDFVNTALDPLSVQFNTVADFPILSFWLAAQHPERPLVRLTLNLPYGGHAVVLDDPINQRLLVVPKLGPAPEAPSPTPVPSPAS